MQKDTLLCFADPCTLYNGNCDHICESDEEKMDIRCSCKEGFYLRPDGIHCWPERIETGTEKH